MRRRANVPRQARDHSVSDSLSYMATWNSVMLQTDDFAKAAVASLSKGEQPDFDNLMPNAKSKL